MFIFRVFLSFLHVLGSSSNEMYFNITNRIVQLSFMLKSSLRNLKIQTLSALKIYRGKIHSVQKSMYNSDRHCWNHAEVKREWNHWEIQLALAVLEILKCYIFIYCRSYCAFENYQITEFEVHLWSFHQQISGFRGVWRSLQPLLLDDFLGWLPNLFFVRWLEISY